LNRERLDHETSLVRRHSRTLAQATSVSARSYCFAVKKGAKSGRRRLLILAAAALLEPVAMKLRGYPIGGNLVVRCRKGHLFTTIWVPGASLKSVRFAWWRLQRCPVGKHWSIVTPVKESELTEAERRTASERKDLRLP
jgi:hypothetical protein